MDGPILSRNIGRLHQGTARCTIGSIPVAYTQDDAPAEETINANITAFIAPGLSMKYKTDGNYKAMVHIPIQEDNQYDNKVLTITMICDDYMENYWTLHRYMETLQSGKTNGYPVMDTNHRVYGFDKFYRNRRTWIPQIDIHMADDSYQKHQIIRFERCYPTELEQFNLNFLTPEPVKFTVSFVYSLKSIIRLPPPTENTSVACIAD